MTIPDYETLMLPVLKLIADGNSDIKSCLPHLKNEFNITDEEAAELIPSGTQTYLANRAHWARTYLAKAGLIESPKRNFHTATPEGRRILAENPSRIDNSILSRFRSFDDWRRRSGQTIDENSTAEKKSATEALSQDGNAFPESPEEKVNSGLREIEANLADEIISRLLSESPEFFERAVVQLLFAMGYGRNRKGAAQTIGRSGDGGIDGIIYEDALGLDSVYIQAKRYALDKTVSRPAIQQFVGSITGEGANKGVFVTTSSFSREAKAYAERVTQRIILIDGQKLSNLMIENEVGVRTVQTVKVREIDANFFPSDG